MTFEMDGIRWTTESLSSSGGVASLEVGDPSQVPDLNCDPFTAPPTASRDSLGYHRGPSHRRGRGSDVCDRERRSRLLLGREAHHTGTSAETDEGHADRHPLPPHMCASPERQGQLLGREPPGTTRRRHPGSVAPRRYKSPDCPRSPPSLQAPITHAPCVATVRPPVGRQPLRTTRRRHQDQAHHAGTGRGTYEGHRGLRRLRPHVRSAPHRHRQVLGPQLPQAARRRHPEGPHARPVPVTRLSRATAVIAGPLHTCAVLANGTVQCWGRNYEGQLGDGPRWDPSAKPVTVGGISAASAAAAGCYHSCAMRSGATVLCWVGTGSVSWATGRTTKSSTPVRVLGIEPALSANA